MTNFDAESHLLGLAGKVVKTPTGQSNLVAEVADGHVFIKTERTTSDEGEPLKIREIQQAADRLSSEGSLAIQTIPHRRSFVAGVLLGLPGVQLSQDRSVLEIVRGQ